MFELNLAGGGNDRRRRHYLTSSVASRQNVIKCRRLKITVFSIMLNATAVSGERVREYTISLTSVAGFCM